MLSHPGIIVLISPWIRLRVHPLKLKGVGHFILLDNDEALCRAPGKLLKAPSLARSLVARIAVTKIRLPFHYTAQLCQRYIRDRETRFYTVTIYTVTRSLPGIKKM